MKVGTITHQRLKTSRIIELITIHTRIKVFDVVHPEKNITGWDRGVFDGSHDPIDNYMHRIIFPKGSVEGKAFQTKVSEITA
ncbi:MAG: hypothetical protein LUG96_08915 [Tannerellaceae bacterium]|nr:hypothetical protein [Tannerellaceae bacterium]